MWLYSISKWCKSIVHHCAVLLLTFLLICGVGAIPVIWLLLKPLPVYNVTGAIRIAPALTDVLTGELDRGTISDYESFMNTQAEMITSNRVVQRVADKLGEPANVLKQSIIKGIITVKPARRSELIKVTMESANPEEAKQIVDVFTQAYMEIKVVSSHEDENRQLTLLENESKNLYERINDGREAIYQLGRGYGTVALESRQETILTRISSLLDTLTGVEAKRIKLEAQVQLLEGMKEKAALPVSEELLIKRKEYIDSDASIEALSERITDFEVDNVVAQSDQSTEDAELKHKAEVLEALKSHLHKRREEVGKTFDEMVSHHHTKAHEATLSETKFQLEQTREYEKRLRQTLSKEDTETIGLGRKQLRIQELQDRIQLAKERYDIVLRRIQDLSLQRKQPTRISVHDYADIVSVRDSRIKYTIGAVFGVIVCGILLAILGKTDRKLSTYAS
ncbi:MAG: GumC family protein [Planctomycetota bacterium]|jgi:capsular polysaccharide biosynthesis protein